MWKSRYSEPSTSQTFEPDAALEEDRVRAARTWYEDGTPFGMTFRERSYMRAEPLVSAFRWALFALGELCDARGIDADAGCHALYLRECAACRAFASTVGEC